MQGSFNVSAGILKKILSNDFDINAAQLKKPIYYWDYEGLL